MTLFSDTSTTLEEVSIDYDNNFAIYDDYYDGMYAIESNKLAMLLDHEKNDLCDGYMEEYIHDATENYYERRTCVFTYRNNIKFLSMC